MIKRVGSQTSERRTERSDGLNPLGLRSGRSESSASQPRASRVIPPNPTRPARSHYWSNTTRLTIHGYGPPKRLSENSTNSWRRRLSDILIGHQLGWLPKASVGYAFPTF